MHVVSACIIFYYSKYTIGLAYKWNFKEKNNTQMIYKCNRYSIAHCTPLYNIIYVVYNNILITIYFIILYKNIK